MIYGTNNRQYWAQKQNKMYEREKKGLKRKKKRVK